MSDTPEFSFMPLSEETMEFPCGHVGPKVYSFTIEGHTFKMDPPEGTSQLDQCAQCYTEYLADTCTHCSRCDMPIIVNSFCSHDFKDGCVCPGCISSPTSQIPSIWDGEKRVPHLPSVIEKVSFKSAYGQPREGLQIKYDYKPS